MARVAGRQFEVLPIPGDARVRQLGVFAGQILIEWPLDSPVVWQVELAPIGVIVIGPRIFDEGDFGAWLPKHGCLELGVAQLVAGARGIVTLEQPAGVE